MKSFLKERGIVVAKPLDSAVLREETVLGTTIVPLRQLSIWQGKCWLHKFLLMESIVAPCKTNMGHMVHRLFFFSITFFFFLSLTPTLIQVAIPDLRLKIAFRFYILMFPGQGIPSLRT